MPQSFAEILYIFFIYAVLGWAVEVIYAAFDDKMFVNRGFLGGPLCPIYGLGVLVVSVVLNPLRDNLLLLFAGSVALATALELVVGWVLERFFNQKWWDYSKRRFNFRGYICLSFSLIWGVALTLVIWIVHPFVLSFIRTIPPTWSAWILPLLVTVFIFDVLYTAAALWNLDRKIVVIDKVEGILKMISDSVGEGIYETTASAIDIGEKMSEYKKELSITLEKNRKTFSRFTKIQLRWFNTSRLLKNGKWKINGDMIRGYFDSVRVRFDKIKEKINLKNRK